MDAATYQREAARTLIDDSAVRPLTPRQHRIVWNAIGLAGEVGEVFTLLPLPEHRSAAWMVCFAGHLLEHIKKGVFHEQGLQPEIVTEYLEEILTGAGILWRNRAILGCDPNALKKELGDCCWYAAALCSVLDLDFATVATDTALDEVFTANITKLKIRFPHGWSVDDAAARVDAA